MPNTVSTTISDETLNRMIQIESAGKANAKAPTSSATGLFQFIKSTWLETVRKHRPDWFVGRTDEQVLGLRYDPIKSIEMGARFTEGNAAFLGPGWTDGDLYLAHFAGVGTAKKLMQAQPGVACSRVFTDAAIAANRSILDGKSCAEVRAWAARRMAACGGRNWIAVYMAGAKPVLPPAVKKAGQGGAVIATGTVATGTQQGWGLSQWLIAIGFTLAAVGAALAIAWYVRGKKLERVGG